MILVTGATGNVGAEVVAQLTARNLPVRIGLRKPGKSGSSVNAEAVRFDFLAPETYASALAGVKKVFLVRPPALGNAKRDINPFIDAAAQRGVEQIVFLSLQGVEGNRFVPHRAIEEHIQSAGVGYTFLRAGFFMQNLSTTHRTEIRRDGRIMVPAGTGKTSFIDVRDIAAVAAKTLAEEGHTNRAYTLTGDEALDYYAVAAALSEELGRAIVYANPSLLGFWRYRRQQGDDLAYIVVMSGIYTVARLGRAGEVTSTVRDLLQRPAITLRQFVHDYRQAWAA